MIVQDRHPDGVKEQTVRERSSFRDLGPMLPEWTSD